MKGINKIANDEVVSLPELEGLKKEIYVVCVVNHFHR